MLENPGPDGPIDWDSCSFATPVKWIGVPDGIVEKLTQLNVEPLISLGYNPMMSLVPDMEFDGIATDDQIDWGASASAYDYYFAISYHYAKDYGARYYLMHNEPDCRVDVFRFPDDIQKRIQSVPRDNPYFTGDETARRRTLACLTTQGAVLARMARIALDDAASLLPGTPRQILAGPTCGLWEPFFLKAQEHLDCLDFHHYHPSPDALENVTRRIRYRAREAGASFSVSEYNLYAGGQPFTRIAFNLSSALELARLLMHSLRLSTEGSPPCEFMTMYEFNYPATDNNHKHLVYGDMNTLDWSCTDRDMPTRGDAWYPTASDLQVRFVTPAFYLFRMLARCVPGTKDPSDSFPVLESSAQCLIGDMDIFSRVETLIVDTGTRLYATFLNMWEGDQEFRLDLQHFSDRFSTAIIRETSRHKRDDDVDQFELCEPRFMVKLPAQSLTQIVLCSEDLSAVTALRLEEHTVTPGGSQELGLLQTTRFRAIATIAGESVDVSDLNTVWTSSEQESVPVHQGGMVQHLRETEGAVTISVRCVDDAAEASVTIQLQ